MKTFFVYTLAKPDGTVFYIGKGSGDRLAHHASEARSKVKSYKNNTIRNLWAQGLDFIATKVFETDDEDAAYEYEAWLIAQYGKENLTNKADGGRGSNKGHIMTEESKQRISQANTGKRRTEEARKIMSEARYKFLERRDAKEIMRAAAQHRPPRSSESKARMSEIMMGKNKGRKNKNPALNRLPDAKPERPPAKERLRVADARRRAYLDNKYGPPPVAPQQY